MIRNKSFLKTASRLVRRSVLSRYGSLLHQRVKVSQNQVRPLSKVESSRRQLVTGTGSKHSHVIVENSSSSSSSSCADEQQIVSLKLHLPGKDGTTSLIDLQAVVGDTLLDTAHKQDINVDGTCDGKLECSTCHCVLGNAEIFHQSIQGDGAICDVEQDLLTQAFDVQEHSRLSCKVAVTQEMDGMEIRFPGIVEKPDPTTSVQDQMLRALLEANPDDLMKEKGPTTVHQITPQKFTNLTKSAIPNIFEKYAPSIPAETVLRYQAMAEVLPFRTNNYVVDELINWEDFENCPMFNLTFPKPHMLNSMDVDGNVTTVLDEITAKLESLKHDNLTTLEKRAIKSHMRDLANNLRALLNPHPAKQKEMNVPAKGVNSSQQQQQQQQQQDDVEFQKGMQHKYRETVLFFPSEAQYCHSYCTYCFRWAQFIGSEGLQFASNDLMELMQYLRENKSVTDLLITGGDPMVLNSDQLKRYLLPLAMDPELSHVTNIRLGSKSLAYWPYKYVTDDDAQGILNVFSKVVEHGKHISFQAHFSHPNELSTPVVKEAIKRIRGTGVNIRAQAPLIKNINDDPQVWNQMWKQQVNLGIIPYYMFIERDTGAKDYFGLPLYRCLDIYNEAIRRSSGLARTARGPSMSCAPGKVCVLGVESIRGEKVFALRFLQARNPDWCDRVFFAEYDETAKWMDDLKPAFGEEKFFFEDEMAEMEQSAVTGLGSSGQMAQD